MIEALWPKRRILEIYLNEVQFGSNFRRERRPSITSTSGGLVE